MYNKYSNYFKYICTAPLNNSLAAEWATRNYPGFLNNKYVYLSIPQVNDMTPIQ